MSYDAVVIGAGPNGLAAAVEVARNGKSVLVLEGHDTVGGGCRTAEVTLPGFRHDVCAAVHPFGVASPYLSRLPLDRYGLEWVFPDVEFTHPLDGGEVAALVRSVDETAAGLGADADRYRRLMAPLAARSEDLFADALGPLIRVPLHPIVTGRFGLAGALPMTVLAGRFRDPRTRAMLAGLGAHSIVPLSRPFTGGVGLALALGGHGRGWPAARGGSQAIVDALAAYLSDLGGEIRTGTPVRSLSDLPPTGAVLADITPRQLADLAGASGRVERRLRRKRRVGPGVFKVDWALSGPIPWADPHSRRAGTVHVGGTFEEIAAAEAATYAGRVVDRPFVLVAQPTLFDTSRAPAGQHTAWGYCHVPTGATGDMTARIEAQVERFAPGFGDLILARATMGPAAYEAYNPNNIGGDITGGELTLGRLLGGPRPYATPLADVYLCSSSTPPGAGVHGMCGFHAARAALRGSLRG